MSAERSDSGVKPEFIAQACGRDGERRRAISPRRGINTKKYKVMGMRFFEITSGIRLPVTRHEQHIIDLFDEQSVIDEQELDNYQLELVRSLVNKDILTRSVTSNTITYCLNTNDDLWRL